MALKKTMASKDMAAGEILKPHIEPPPVGIPAIYICSEQGMFGSLACFWDGHHWHVPTMYLDDVMKTPVTNTHPSRYRRLNIGYQPWAAGVIEKWAEKQS